MRFGVVVPGEDELRSALERNGDELERMLVEVAGRAELRVTVYYDEEAILREIVAEDQAVARLREATRSVPGDAGYFQRVRLGELVADAMGRKRQSDEARILGRLRPLAEAVESQGELPEAVVVRASFLVETAKLGDFEAALEDVSRDFEGRGRVKSVGPLPPYSFVDVRLPPPEGA